MKKKEPREHNKHPQIKNEISVQNEEPQCTKFGTNFGVEGDKFDFVNEKLEIQEPLNVVAGAGRGKVDRKAKVRERGPKREAKEVVCESCDDSVDIESGKYPKGRGKSRKLDDQLPQNFDSVWNAIWDMRKSRDAPVDIMGCDKFGGDPRLPSEAKRFHKLIACMLSSQTRDETNAACMGRLRDFGLSVENMIECPEENLAEILKGVSFHNTKAKHIKQTAEILRDEYNGDIPSSVEELCALPGVGPKMAYIVIHAAWGMVEGIPVDVHVHRIANRLGWVETKHPEQTRQSLQAFLPRQNWAEINPLLVGFGQQICRPIGPKCHCCSARANCPTGKNIMKSPKKKSKHPEKSEQPTAPETTDSETFDLQKFEWKPN